MSNRKDMPKSRDNQHENKSGNTSSGILETPHSRAYKTYGLDVLHAQPEKQDVSFGWLTSLATNVYNLRSEINGLDPSYAGMRAKRPAGITLFKACHQL